MRRFLTTVAGLLVLLVPVAWQAQQESPQRAAEQALREVFDAHERMQWGRIVLLLHPDAIPLLHQSELRSMEAMESAREPPTRDPGYPECVAEYFAKQRAEHEQNFPSVYKSYGVASLDELRSLSTEAVMRRAGRDWRLWPGEGNLFKENGFISVAIGEMYASTEQVQKLSKEIVSWDGKTVAPGRAHLAGFGDSKDEQALVIQVGRDRMRFPRSAFADISRLLEIGFMVPER